MYTKFLWISSHYIFKWQEISKYGYNMYTTPTGNCVSIHIYKQLERENIIRPKWIIEHRIIFFWRKKKNKRAAL